MPISLLDVLEGEPPPKLTPYQQRMIAFEFQRVMQILQRINANA